MNESLKPVGIALGAKAPNTKLLYVAKHCARVTTLCGVAVHNIYIRKVFASFDDDFDAFGPWGTSKLNKRNPT